MWGPWEGPTKIWVAMATAQELYHVARFHIMESLVTAIPKDEMPGFRYRVAWHRYRCMHLVAEFASQPPYAAQAVNDTTESG